MSEKIETRPRRVTLSSEERCAQAFDRWYASLNIREGAADYETDLDHQAYQMAWIACWKYLEQQVVKEFIER